MGLDPHDPIKAQEDFGIMRYVVAKMRDAEFKEDLAGSPRPQAQRWRGWQGAADRRRPLNKPVGDQARRGAVRKRTQRKGKLMGKTAWTQRDKTSGEFMSGEFMAAKKSICDQSTYQVAKLG